MTTTMITKPAGDKSLVCRALTADELAAALRGSPVQLWNTPATARVYADTLGLVCVSRRGTAIGAWVVPLDSTEYPPAARRPSRLLPYASPWVDPDLHPSTRHRVVLALTDALMARTDTVELPMDPQFSEVAALLEAGLDVPSRHTRILDTRVPDLRAGYLPTVRNHIRAAARTCIVKAIEPEEFDFDRGIVGQSAETVAARRRSGLEMSRENPVLCLAAIDGDGVCQGQAFILASAGSAILMHSWFDRDGIRGVPSLLVDTAISRSAEELGTPVFDFEGSVIPGIDRFMAGFGASAVAYPQARWKRQARSTVEFA
jgi:hypothetical protein